MKRLDEHGQMILIAGFIIGIGIVVLTVMLNNIIYASNTASESSIETNVFDYSNVVDTTIEAYEKAYANNNTFDAYMDSYSEQMVKSYSLSGFIFTLDTGALQDAYFTENGLDDGNDDWIVIERVNYTDLFLLGSLNASALGNESNKFVIEVNNQSGNTIWSASIFNSSNGNINLTVYDGSYILNSENSSFSEINITNNKIDEDETNLFDFHFNNQTANQTYSIKFINGSKVMGTFLIEGDLVNGNSFYIERVEVVNSNIKLNKNGHLEINATIPITLPRGHV
ncbi:hypothetical protein RE474_05740 [Methanolobus sediminis]|uniref:Uncharacterized protein n=1 Tax=Methanolobus sediminis TaxID=3072978 RepID=A0AA51UM97_9EURY|nr:hypothetical protein [Methanolobus sediminis]WMW26213.1 hypothetical protein RE474_05740 [Methanolobus sediminis]